LGAVILTEIPTGERFKEGLGEINRLVSVLSQLADCSDAIQLALGQTMNPASARVIVGPCKQPPVLGSVGPGVLQRHYDRWPEDNSMFVEVQLKVGLTLQPERLARKGGQR
jgi:hypothetical protein